MENQFGFEEVSTEHMHLDQIPQPDETWDAISRFALSFDGYEYWGSLEACGAIANARRHDSLVDLRTCLFFEQRRYHHFGSAPGASEMEYIRTIVKKIRSAVEEQGTSDVR